MTAHPYMPTRKLMSRPAILQVIPRLDAGGAEQTTLEITQALNNVGCRSLVATEGGRHALALEQMGGEIFEMPMGSKNPIRIMRNGQKLAKLIIDQQIDLVHARSRAPAWSAFMAAKMTGRPFVTTYHGAYNQKTTVKAFYNSIMARGDLVIANSHYTADLVSKRHHLPADHLRVIHRGVDLTEFHREHVSEERKARLRERWGVSAEDRLILHAARLTSWKGQKLLIEAAGVLAQQGLLDQVVFILAGDAQGRKSYLNELEAAIKEHKVTGRVRIVGHCDDMAAACAMAYVVAVPSTEPEAFGRAAAEAQAATCPVIVSDLGAVPETVRGIPFVDEAEATGWRVAAGDVQAWVNAIATSLRMTHFEHMRMAANAREHVAQNFSGHKMKYETLRVYDELIGSRIAPLYLRLQMQNHPQDAETNVDMS